MSDAFLAGVTLTDGHFPESIDDREDVTYTFTNTTFGVGTITGTHTDCGGAFVASASGKVIILWGGNHSNSAGSTFLCPVVRTGAVVGSGTSVLAATNAISSGSQTAVVKAGRSHLLDGLTPGDTYNVRLEHKVSSGTGTLLERNVIVFPVP